ncbi:transcriptional regulator, TetR family [Mesorhizobium albiziae]|uniref:Transcriptional regulator, TetR family n=1 Tax=Neomesorhizobium albiziae TaxID=335020 RepID=A0A1I4B2F6_9HYPH|nr:TetR/AcrR family transcriptional regulator [Mesorhizobium albiziae]GLS34278.1 TetR family transcriptional regulator [Mesorhizobium albiziae]SFK62884.1 transcriptional regulator, TetR family [Mesorhizobium albiziae]
MPEEARRRTRTNDPEGLRQKILDVAEAAFQEKGYHATSLGDLMRAAGVTGGALHHHFPTKKAIGLAVISERVAAAVEETWIRPVSTASSARDGVRNVFAMIADELDAQGFVRGCPLNNLAHELSLADSDFRAALERIFARWRDSIADKARSDRDGGNSDGATDPDGFAALTVAIYSGAMSMAKTAQDASMLRVCAEGFLEVRPRSPT